MANAVTWFEIMGRDAAALQSFYSGLFGWELQDAGGPTPYGMLEASDGGIGGAVGAAGEGPGHVTVYVSVDDPQAYLDKAEKLGGKTVLGVTEIPDMVTFALFADPEGHVVGVVKNQS
jgi:predicted enzyme related to lactoylglutathione lyase